MGARSVRLLWRQRFGMSGYESPSIGTFGLVKGFGTGQRHTEHSALAAYARFWVSTSKWWSTSLLLAKRVGTRRHESSEGTVGAAAHQVGIPRPSADSVTSPGCQHRAARRRPAFHDLGPRRCPTGIPPLLQCSGADVLWDLPQSHGRVLLALATGALGQRDCLRGPLAGGTRGGLGPQRPRSAGRPLWSRRSRRAANDKLCWHGHSLLHGVAAEEAQ